MASPWRTTFNPDLPIRMSAKSEEELNKRIADNESRGYELVDRYVDTKRLNAATTYEKHIAEMRKKK